MSEKEWEARDNIVREKLKRESDMTGKHERRRIFESLMDAGLSQRHLREIFSGKSLQNNKPIRRNQAYNAIIDFSENGLYVLSGSVGSGKSLAATSWLLNAGLGNPMHSWRTSGVRMVKASWLARQSRYNGDEIDKLCRIPFLAIDDIGTEYNDASGSFAVDFGELIDARWENSKGTLISTNLDNNTFRNRYGERVYDRIKSSDSWMSVSRESYRIDSDEC